MRQLHRVIGQPSHPEELHLRNKWKYETYRLIPSSLIFHSGKQQFVAGTELGAHVTQSLELMQPTAASPPLSY